MNPEDNSPKRQRTLYRGVVITLMVVFLGVCAGFATVLAQTWREYEGFAERKAEHRERLAELRSQKADREAYLRKLLDDPDFLDRVVRDRLNYSREDEVIFKFDRE